MNSGIEYNKLMVTRESNCRSGIEPLYAGIIQCCHCCCCFGHLTHCHSCIRPGKNHKKALIDEFQAQKNNYQTASRDQARDKELNTEGLHFLGDWSEWCLNASKLTE